MTKKIVTLAGDGIGPEIMTAGLEVLAAVAPKIGFDYSLEDKPFGGAGIDASGHPLPQDTLKAAKGADAILLEPSGVLSMTMLLFVQNKACSLFVRN